MIRSMGIRFVDNHTCGNCVGCEILLNESTPGLGFLSLFPCCWYK